MNQRYRVSYHLYIDNHGVIELISKTVWTGHTIFYHNNWIQSDIWFYRGNPVSSKPANSQFVHHSDSLFVYIGLHKLPIRQPMNHQWLNGHCTADHPSWKNLLAELVDLIRDRIQTTILSHLWTRDGHDMEMSGP